MIKHWNMDFTQLKWLLGNISQPELKNFYQNISKI